MHYLADDEEGCSEVFRRLENSGKQWLLVRFYFDFRADTGIANTTLGLLRSLLSQLIEESMDVKNFVWKRCQHRLRGNWPELEAELLELFCEAVKSTKVSICGLVDGLDEYKGSLSKLVDFLLMIQRRIGAKICLASRPETELSYRLRGFPTFAMQDYNHATIEAYIENAIADIGYFVPVKQLRDILQDEVLAYADGVILWAIFAVDEAVKAALHGCASNEIRQRVRSFPQELTSVYRRIWNNMSPGDQLLAAVILLVIQHWGSSLNREPRPLPLDSVHLTCCCRTILRRLDPDFELDTNYSELHFRLKTYAMLSGLVEFTGQRWSTAKLAHKSVGSFLETFGEYVRQTERIQQIVDIDVLGPRFFAEVLVETCDALIPDFEYLNSLCFETREMDGWDVSQVLCTPSTLSKFLALKRNRSLDCEVETIKSALVYASELIHVQIKLKWGQRQPYAALMVSMSRTWLIQYYAMPLAMDGIDGSHKFVKQSHLPDSYRAPPDWKSALSGKIWVESILPNYNHPEILYLARCEFHHALKLVAQQADKSNGVDYLLILLVLMRFYLNYDSSYIGKAGMDYMMSIYGGELSFEEESVKVEVKKLWNLYLSRIK